MRVSTESFLMVDTVYNTKSGKGGFERERKRRITQRRRER